MYLSTEITRYYVLSENNRLPYCFTGMEHLHSTHSKRWGCPTSQPTFLLWGTW